MRQPTATKNMQAHSMPVPVFESSSDAQTHKHAHTISPKKTIETIIGALPNSQNSTVVVLSGCTQMSKPAEARVARTGERARSQRPRQRASD